jgi:hypothetical protein
MMPILPQPTRVRVLVIHTREALMVAREVRLLLSEDLHASG